MRLVEVEEILDVDFYGLEGEDKAGYDWGSLILMVGFLVASLDSSSDLESEAFLFRVVLGSEGFGFKGGSFFVFLTWFEGLGSNDGEGGSFLFFGKFGSGLVGFRFRLGLLPRVFAEM